MTITDKMCPRCGATVYDRDVCPECGAELPDDSPEILESGDRISFRVPAGAFEDAPRDVELDCDCTFEVELYRIWSESESRTVFAAELQSLAPITSDESSEDDGEEISEETVDDDADDEASSDEPEDDPSLPNADDLEDPWFLVEDLGMREQPEELIRDIDVDGPRFRRPLAETTMDGNRRVVLYRNRGGISLEQFVELQGGELSFHQVKALFNDVLEALEALHGAGYLHLRMAPSRIRLVERGTSRGIPLSLLAPDVHRAESEGAVEVNLPSEDEEDKDARDRNLEQYNETRPQGVPSLQSREETVEDLEPIDDDLEADDAAGLQSETSPEIAEDRRDHWLEGLGLTRPDPASENDDRDRSPRDETDVDPRRVTVAFGDSRPSIEIDILLDAIDGVVEPEDVSVELACVQGYAAPEFYRRTVDAFEPLSDVFSLGMILYFLVAGRRPPTSVYTRHTPAIPARNFHLAFPPGLDPVVKRSTRPDPESRFPDLSSMKSAFDNAVEIVESRHGRELDSVPEINVAVERHIGIAKREQNPVNQDDVLNCVSDDRQFALTVVADGVSTATYGSGDIASGMLVEEAELVWEELREAYTQGETIDPFERVEEIIHRGNERIVDYVNEHHTPFTGSPHEVMGTTALVAIYHEGCVTVGSVGDSRTYLQRGPGLEQLTIDHNLWTLSILSGMSADDALAMPQGDALARCLGTFELEGRQLRPIPPEADIVQWPVASDDTLLLTTDGLIDFAGGNVEASEENILATLLSEPNPALACLELVLLANRGGGGDNIGVGIASFE